MADNTTLNTGVGGDIVALEEIAGVKYQKVKLIDGTASSTTPVGTATNPLRFDTTGATTQPVSGPLTDTQLRATAVPVSGTVTASGPLTDTQLRATAVPVSGTVTANAGTGTLAVSGPLTDTQLRATAVPISGSVSVSSAPTTAVTGTFFQATQPVSGSITDAGSGKTLKSASFSLSATGTAIAAVASKRLKVYAVKLIASAAISVNWRDGASTALEGAQSLAINGGYVESVDPPGFLFGTTAGNSLDLVMTGVGTAAGRVSYWDDDAS